ncbi:hypothetical protein COB57_05310 [Candidatus Peregrinibacteria bacterium]|nr:MAG: hypothetical protein COB57_05310 [Candidatus Peregrinibacteria bacterium]
MKRHDIFDELFALRKSASLKEFCKNFLSIDTIPFTEKLNLIEAFHRDKATFEVFHIKKATFEYIQANILLQVIQNKNREKHLFLNFWQNNTNNIYKTHNPYLKSFLKTIKTNDFLEIITKHDIFHDIYNLSSLTSLKDFLENILRIDKISFIEKLNIIELFPIDTIGFQYIQAKIFFQAIQNKNQEKDIFLQFLQNNEKNHYQTRNARLQNFFQTIYTNKFIDIIKNYDVFNDVYNLSSLTSVKFFLINFLRIDKIPFIEKLNVINDFHLGKKDHQSIQAKIFFHAVQNKNQDLSTFFDFLEQNKNNQYEKKNYTKKLISELVNYNKYLLLTALENGLSETSHEDLETKFLEDYMKNSPLFHNQFFDKANITFFRNQIHSIYSIKDAELYKKITGTKLSKKQEFNIPKKEEYVSLQERADIDTINWKELITSPTAEIKDISRFILDNQYYISQPKIKLIIQTFCLSAPSRLSELLELSVKFPKDSILNQESFFQNFMTHIIEYKIKILINSIHVAFLNAPPLTPESQFFADYMKNSDVFLHKNLNKKQRKFFKKHIKPLAENNKSLAGKIIGHETVKNMVDNKLSEPS